MPNKNYNNGRAKEYQIMSELRKEGYTCCRAAGSHGVFDIIAWRPDSLRFIQCKKAPVFMLSAYKDDLMQMGIEATPISTKDCKVTKELWVSVDRKGWEKIVL